MRIRALQSTLAAPVFALGGAPTFARQPRASQPQRIGQNLDACDSDNDGSANSNFPVTSEGILVVDTGLNPHEAQKLLAAVRSVSSQPIRYLINTHHHPDHQGGNATLSKDAVVTTPEFTR